MYETIIPVRYSNANWFACAIVAVVNREKNTGEVIDWVAYWGGCPDNISEQDAYQHVARNGDKLWIKDAMYYCPALPENLYRR